MKIMNIKTKIFLFVIFFIANAFVLFGGAEKVFSQNTAQDKFLTGINDTRVGAGYEDLDSSSIDVTIGKVIRIIISSVGVIFLALMVWGGYIWMKASGNEQDVEKAKKIITNSILGLAVVAAAYAITVVAENIIF
ncbi:MAG: hypothetical protein ABH881_03525 [bacterium]